MCVRDLGVREREDLIIIGKIVKTHGITGEVRVLSLTDFPDRFREGLRVVIECLSGEKISHVVEKVRMGRGFLLMRFFGVSECDGAKKFIGGWMKVPRQEAVPLPEGYYYHYDLIGMVVTSEKGEYYGEVVGILQTGSNDIFVIRRGEEEHLIPGIRDVVRGIDLERKQMTIYPMEGLFH